MLFFARLCIYVLGGVALLWAVATETLAPKTVAKPNVEVAETDATSSPVTADTPAALATQEIPTLVKTTPATPDTPKETKTIPLPKKPLTPVTKTAPLSPLPTAAVTPVPIPAPELPTVPLLSFDELNQKTREALVNILCTSKRGGSFNPISGSGIFVDPRGVILTNAHVGQYFLLKDYLTPDFLDCIIRTGEPAHNRYKARLLYISPAWVATNAKKINLSEPLGTGENDFALLLITGTTLADMPLPEAFPFLPTDSDDSVLQKPIEVLVAGYPAGLLGGINIQRDLYPSSAVVYTGNVYSFDEGTSDIFSIGSSVVAQQGSSGGAVVSKVGKLIGLIATASMGRTTGERDLNALTMSHLNASFKTHTGDDLASLFRAGDLHASADSFNEKIAPILKKVLEGALAGE